MAIVLIAFTLSASAQGWIEKNYSRTDNVPTLTLSSDNSYTVDVSDGSYYLDSEFVWSGLNASDATIQVQTSSTLEGENFVDFSSLSPLELKNGTSRGKIVDWSYPITTKRVRWKVYHGSVTSGTLTVYINVVRIK